MGDLYNQSGHHIAPLSTLEGVDRITQKEIGEKTGVCLTVISHPESGVDHNINTRKLSVSDHPAYIGKRDVCEADRG